MTSYLLDAMIRPESLWQLSSAAWGSVSAPRSVGPSQTTPKAAIQLLVGSPPFFSCSILKRYHPFADMVRTDELPLPPTCPPDLPLLHTAKYRFMIRVSRLQGFGHSGTPRPKKKKKSRKKPRGQALTMFLRSFRPHSS